MSEMPFHATAMGRMFYEAHVPRIVTALETLVKRTERLEPTSPSQPVLEARIKRHCVDYVACLIANDKLQGGGYTHLQLKDLVEEAFLAGAQAVRQ